MDPGGLLFFLFGCTMLQLICCYSDGRLLDTECGMNINHERPPQDPADNPFNVDPDFTAADMGTPTTVKLSATSSSFNGFMLIALKCEECSPAGTFILTDPSSAVLLSCDGQHGRAVSHSDNLKKKSVTVNWTAPETGTFYFRAAFSESYSRFWLRNPVTTTPAPPTTTQSTTTASTTAFTTPYTTGTDAAITTAETTATNHTGSTTNTTAVIPPSVLVDVKTFQICVLALLLFSRLFFLGGSSVMLISPVLKAVYKSQFALELTSKIIAFILIVIRAKKYPSVWRCAFFGAEFTALTGIAMVLSLLHTITIFLYCGPSHELRKCWLYAVIVFHLLNTSITTAAIFVGVWCFQGCWLPILMGVYVMWEILLYLISHRCKQGENLRRNAGAGIQNRSQKRVIYQRMIFVFLSVLNIMFTIALITGVSVTRMVAGLFPGQGLD